MRCKVWKTDFIYGVYWMAEPTWVMHDGWTHYICESWEDAMRKARRRLRGQAA